MASNYNIEYNVDIVMCIDATGSMGGLINTVKSHALSFYSDVTKAMEADNKHIDQLRVRIVAFRDYIADGPKAMLTTDFFTLPAEAAEFKDVLDSIRAEGGGDDPEDGLEALAYAINSDWTKGGNKRRHIIVVWSDDGTHELGFGKNPENRKYYYNISQAEAEKNTAHYPKFMAKDFDELTDWWGDAYHPGKMDNNAKRLLIYAPDKSYWSTISDSWDPVLHFTSEAGKGLQDLQYEEILERIRNSI